MSPQELARIFREAERQVPIEVRARSRLTELEYQVEFYIKELEAGSGGRFTRLKRGEIWLKIRKLTRHGKRIATRFKEEQAKKFFGVLFNTASVYLGLPVDRDWQAEAYALTRH